MAYLLDADVLIRAKREHYRFATFPCFWDFVLARVMEGTIRSVQAVKRDLEEKEDDLTAWIASACPDYMFVGPDDGTISALATVSKWAMAPERPYRLAAREEFLSVSDSLLVAHALAHGHTVVTHEKPSPESKKKIKIPDVCNALDVAWLDCYAMLEAIGAKF